MQASAPIVPPIAPGAGPYRLAVQVGHLLRRAHQRHAMLFLEGFAEHGLTPTQWAALDRLVGLGEATQNLLGRQTAMDPATIQGVVRRLVARGLVRRGTDPADRRSVRLSPTAAGVALHQACLAQAFAVSAATLAPLDAAEASTFLALLRRLA